MLSADPGTAVGREELVAVLDATEAFDRLRLVIAGGTEAGHVLSQDDLHSCLRPFQLAILA